jgi:hypothetical protein
MIYYLFDIINKLFGALMFLSTQELCSNFICIVVSLFQVHHYQKLPINNHYDFFAKIFDQT